MNHPHASTSPRRERRSALIRYLVIGIFGYILGTLSDISQPRVVKFTRKLVETNIEDETLEETGDHEGSQVCTFGFFRFSDTRNAQNHDQAQLIS